MKENLKYEDILKDPQEEMPTQEAQTPPEKQQPDVKPPKASKKKSKGPNKARKALQEFLGGDYLSKEAITGNIGYIIFLGFLTMVFISNTYYTEKIFKTIERTKNELKELRYQYISTKSMLMYQGRQSEISKKALGLGLKESKNPPYKIQYSAETLKNQAK